MTPSSLDVPELTMLTTASLSQKSRIRRLVQSLPHRRKETAIGKSSLKVICWWASSAGQERANQWTPRTPPHPSEPAASVVNWKSGRGAQWGERKKLRPRQETKNSRHHKRS